MGEMGCLRGEIKDSAPKNEFNAEIWGEGGVRHMGEMGCPRGEIKLAEKNESNAEIWGKGVCDIWEEWVVCVEK